MIEVSRVHKDTKTQFEFIRRLFPVAASMMMMLVMMGA